MILVDVYAGNGGYRPGNEGGVAVLAENVCVNVFLADVVVFRKAGAKTGGVEQCARSEHAILRDTRNLGENIGQNVDRVCHDDIDGIGSVFCNLGSDLLDDVGVDLGKLKTGLACLTGNCQR